MSGEPANGDDYVSRCLVVLAAYLPAGAGRRFWGVVALVAVAEASGRAPPVFNS
jgi:hypothetical protein